MENSRAYFSAAMNRHGNSYSVAMAIDGVATLLSDKNKTEFMGDPNYLSCFGQLRHMLKKLNGYLKRA